MTARYERIRKLGSGGMGSVYLVWDAERQRAVAQKRILEPGASTLLRFKREFRAVERLRHPNLVRLLELGSDDDGLFITMEVLDGVEWRAYFGRERRGRTGVPTGPPDEEPASDFEAETVLDDGSDPSVPEVRPGQGSGSHGAESPDPERGEDSRVAEPAKLLERLAHVLPQLIEALAFLHGHNVVHRDLKPANVMVTGEGVVKLLDFGVLARIGLADGGESDLSGTPGYMAPEQIRGDPPSPANDLYALGALLFELVAGQPVFTGSPMALILRHVEEDPPSLSVAAPWAPEALADACHMLLRKAPEDRPSLRVLARSLLPALGARDAIFQAPRPLVPALVGRQPLQSGLRQRVERVREGGFSFVALTGPTGAGKTALAEWLAEEMAGQGLTVLRGRGRPSERVPFNALDGVIDDLARLLGQLHRRRLERSVVVSMTTASAAFGVLRPRRPQGPSGGEVSRRAVFSALADLLAHCAADGDGVLILVDDLQWADGDSVTLLDHLVTAAPAGVTMVTTLRDDVGENAAQAWLEGSGAVEWLQVEPLEEEALQQIVRREARLAGFEPGDHEVREAAAACSGRPIFAELAGRELGRAPAGRGRSLGTSVRGLLAETGSVARELLALVVAVDTWADESLLAEALSRPAGEISDELAELGRLALLRRAGAKGPGGRVDVYHDAVRTALAAVLGEGELSAAHGRLVDVLQGGDAPPERLVRHLLGAGREQQAAVLAQEAATRAEEQQAFGLAAEMYEVALLHPGARRLDLLKGRARTLGLAARYRESAELWREVGQQLQGEEALDAALREAHARLSANDIGGGHDRLNRALVEAGEPRVDAGLSRWLAAAAFLTGPVPLLGGVLDVSSGRGVVERLLGRPSVPDQTVRLQGERDIQIAMLVAHFDPLTGVRFMQRAQRRLARAGEVEQAAFCDYLFSFIALFGAAKAGPVDLARRYQEAAERRLGGREPTLATVRIMPSFLRAVVHFRAADCVAARRELTYCERVLVEAGLMGTYEYMRVVYHQTMASYFQTDLEGLEANLVRWRAASADADNLATRSNRAILEAIQRVQQGRLHEAREQLLGVASAYPPDHLNLQRDAMFFMSNLPDVFDQDCREARRRLAALTAMHRSFRGLNDMYASIYAGVGALVEANALRSGDPGASRFLVHLYAARARDAPPLRPGWAIRAEAYAADATGDPELALAYLQEAEDTAARYDQRLEVAVARYQRGLRLGGDEGRDLRTRAEATVSELGVAPILLQEDVGYR